MHLSYTNWLTSLWHSLGLASLVALSLPNAGCVEEQPTCSKDGTWVAESKACVCNTGYSGDGIVCSDVDECAASPNPCGDGAARCINEPGDYRCECKQGYEIEGKLCVDIDECAGGLGPCQQVAHAGACENLSGSYRCTCAAGYSPTEGGACTDVDECQQSPNPCGTGASACTNKDGSYDCSCLAGYSFSGGTCADINECDNQPFPCHADAACTNANGSYSCACKNGYIGNGSRCYKTTSDQMVLIPAGELVMGSDPEEGAAQDEEPEHRPYLSGYYIDIHEVTNRQYSACVSAGACTLPGDTGSWTRDDYYGNEPYDSHPVLYVDWDQAAAYCKWAGKRLPTEAEWEKAARGGCELGKSGACEDDDERRYPWADQEAQAATCQLANIVVANDSACLKDTARVGSYPDGASPYWVLDMAGNVWEWVADWFGADYYDTCAASCVNPTGPNEGTRRVMRGGSFYRYA
ncbi:MAG: SUMF1/EgtB/PvdO family nonheme iron enzyme, partial [Pseudomonadota bacterium]